MSYFPKTLIQFADSANLDASARIRVSTPETIFSSKQLLNNAPLEWNDASTGGTGYTSTYNTNQAQTTLSVQGGTAGSGLRQTYQRFNYQPGKSQSILMTGCLGASGIAGATGITRRLGYYDNNNGFFFSYVNTTLNIGLRTNTSGAPTDTIVPQSSWNIDKMDGTGVSGITLDITKAQIWIIDFIWLGYGRIRYGVDIAGQIYYVHQILPANTQQLVSIGVPNLPMRYEIISLGTGAASNFTMTHVCSSIVSEAGAQGTGYPFSADTGATALTTGSDTDIYPLVAIQFQSSAQVAQVILNDFSVSTTTASANFRIALLLNPTIHGPLVYSGVTGSTLQYAGGTGATITPGSGTLLYSTWASSSTKGQINLEGAAPPIGLGVNIAGTSDTLVLAVQPVPGAATVLNGSLTWQEYV